MTKIMTPGSGSTEMITGVYKMRIDWYGKGYMDVEKPVRVTHQKDISTYEQANGWLVSVRNNWDSIVQVPDKE